MKQAIDSLTGNLRMMSIPVLDPSYIYEDNMLFINSTSKPELVLKKKSNSVCYHVFHESVAMGKSLLGNILRGKNVAVQMTKVIDGQR